MSATYNWTYQPGSSNPYSINIPSTADDVRPANVWYVALFGNDATGNGSRRKPYRTITKAYSLLASGDTLILGGGTYREAAVIQGSNRGSVRVVGDGDVKIDISYNFYLFNFVVDSMGFYNITIIGDGSSSYIVPGGSFNGLIAYDCIFDGCFAIPPGNYCDFQDVRNTVFMNFAGVMQPGYSRVGAGCLNVTFAYCNISFNNGTLDLFTNAIFYYCNIAGNTSVMGNIRYSLFYQCNFKFNGLGSVGAFRPTTPAGYTYYSDINSLKSAYNTQYGLNGYSGCAFGDPLFINSGLKNYALQSSSPAKNMSYFGTFIGGLGIGLAILARATESAGSFVFASAVNLTIADDSITFTDPSQNAQIDTQPQLNQLGRIIQKFPIFGFNSDRNGQYVDTIADLGATLNAGDTLSVPVSYLVKVGAIVYNGATYQPGDRLTTVTGQTTFTTGASGILIEITEAPERHTIMARFNDGGTMVLSTDALVSGNWYFVVTGSAVYKSNTYSAGSYFLADDTSSWSGTATVELAMPDETTLPFQHYDPAFQPTTNNVGDVRTGAVVRGNGDPAYVRGTGKEWPINTKHMQFRYMLKSNNLTP